MEKTTVAPLKLITAMFHKQNEMNIAIRPDWRTNKPEAFHTACWKEAAEMLDWLDWKWWKAGSENLAQLRLEVIDILHFGLSMQMVQNPELAIEDLARLESWFAPAEYADKLPITEKIGVLAGDAALHRRFSVVMFNALVRELGMTPEMVFSLYMGKNVLNHFRLQNGYKEGTYVKTWDGLEDNDYMMSVVEGINPETFEADLHELLTAKYAEVKAAV